MMRLPPSWVSLRPKPCGDFAIADDDTFTEIAWGSIADLIGHESAISSNMMIAKPEIHLIVEWCLVRGKWMSSPYLESNRLADVIAAIQIMGLSDEYRRHVSGWVYRITGLSKDAQKEHDLIRWVKIFKEHPEFFREAPTYKDHFALVMRRAYDQRNVLSDAEINLLISTAITMHRNQVEAKRDKRWWINLIIPFLGSLVGASIPFIGKAIFG